MSMTKNQKDFDRLVNGQGELSPLDILIGEIRYQQWLLSKPIIHPKPNQNDTKKIS